MTREFENTLHKSITKIYTRALQCPTCRGTDIPSKKEAEEVRQSVRYIIKWCIKHGADIPKCDN